MVGGGGGEGKWNSWNNPNNGADLKNTELKGEIMEQIGMKIRNGKKRCFFFLVVSCWFFKNLIKIFLKIVWTLFSHVSEGVHGAKMMIIMIVYSPHSASTNSNSHFKYYSDSVSNFSNSN